MPEVAVHNQEPPLERITQLVAAAAVAVQVVGTLEQELHLLEKRRHNSVWELLTER